MQPAAGPRRPAASAGDQRVGAPSVVDAEATDPLGVGGRRRTDPGALRDALEDHREAEHREREVERLEVPLAPGALAVAADVVLLARNAERRRVEILDPVVHRPARMPEQAV